MNCLNCNALLDGDFCRACGQKGNTKRISFKSVVHDFIHAFTHADKGFLLLLKDLLVKPGIVAREYIEGKRKKYFNPLTFLVICAAVGFYFVSATDFYTPQDLSRMPEGSIWHDVFTFTNRHMKTLDVFLLAPLITLLGWMFFRKPKYNLAEHFVLQAFVLAQGLNIRTLIFIPLFTMLPRYGGYVNQAFQLTLLVYMIYAYRQFFRQHIALTIMKTILIMILFIILFWGLLIGFFYLNRLLLPH